MKRAMKLKMLVFTILILFQTLHFTKANAQVPVFSIENMTNHQVYETVSLKPYIDTVTSSALPSEYFEDIGSLENKTLYRFQLQGGETSSEFRLRFDYVSYVWMFYEEHDKWVVKRTGTKLQPEEKDLVFDLYNLIEIGIGAHEVKNYYFCLDDAQDNGLTVQDLEIYEKEDFQSLLDTLGKVHFSFLMISLSLFLYNICLFLITKEKLYAQYIPFFMGGIIFISGFYFFSPYFSAFQTRRIAFIFLNLMFFSFNNFTLEFLKPSNVINARFQYAGYPFILGGAIQVFELFFMEVPHLFRFSEHMTMAGGLALTFIMPYLAFKALKNGFKPAKYFILANGFCALCAFVAIILHFIVIMYDVIPINTLIIREFNLGIGGIGIISQVVLYSLAIGNRILSLEKEKSLAIEEKLKVQEDINIHLEDKVTQRTAQLEHRNHENELLLGEIHHRVKNNLQVISSLLKLQSRQLDDGEAKNAVLEGRDRVKAMALIHQRLYQQDRFSAIEMHDYVQNLVANLAQSYGYDDESFQLDLQVPELHLDVDTAIPLGLIINELVSNAFKHAFARDRDNRLLISLMENKSELSLTVQDNGKGLTRNEEFQSETSFGLQLISALTEELNGTTYFENRKGTNVSIRIKDYKIVEEV